MAYIFIDCDDNCELSLMGGHSLDKYNGLGCPIE